MLMSDDTEPSGDSRRDRQAELEELRGRVEQLEDIVRCLPFGLIFIDEKDRVAIANPVGSEIRCVGDRVGESVADCHPADTHVTLEKVMRRFRETPPEEQHPIVLERMQRYEVTYSRVSATDGAYRGVLWLAHDISRRKRLERQLLHAERLAGLGRMAAKVAHDIKNPLNAIQGAAHYLRDGSSAEEKDDLTGLIKEQVARIADLVTRLNTLTRPFDLELGPVNVAEVIAAQLRSCQLAHPGATWTLEVAENVPEVPADLTLLERLVCNAAENAATAMEGGGELRVTVDHRTEANGAWVTICFQDAGPGFPDEVLQNLFQPFLTTRSDGTGLGLTIMREICLLHGGELVIENTDGGALVKARLSSR